MALHLLADDPMRWAGLSLWVPLTDLARWHDEDKAADGRYYRDVEACCGGPPGPDTAAEYRTRSPPLDKLPAAVAGVPIDLNAGVRDGHVGAVPIGHTLRAFNALAEANSVDGGAEMADVRFDETQITELENLGRGLDYQCVTDAYGKPRMMEGRARGVLLRREKGEVRVTVFAGGHEGDPAAALRWLETLERR